MPSIGPFGKNRKAGGAASGYAAVPHIILAGSGVHDRLELTVETQRVIARYGKVFAIGMAAAPRALLKSMRVKVVDLDASFTAERPFEDIYSEVVAQLIEHTAVERPVVLLCPGNHLFLNSVARALVIEGRRLGLTVQILPGVSAIDVLINDIGVDVGLFGLQVFDAHWLVTNDLSLNSRAPGSGS